MKREEELRTDGGKREVVLIGHLRAQVVLSKEGLTTKQVVCYSSNTNESELDLSPASTGQETRDKLPNREIDCRAPTIKGRKVDK